MKKNKMEQKPARKWLPRILIIYLIYLLLGALLPFAFHTKPSNETISDFRYTDYTGNSPSKDQAYVVEDNEEALAIRLAMFQQAKEEIILSTFDIRPGKSWDKIAAALLDAADRGVKVRILVDGMYGMIHMKNLPQFYAAGTHPNIEIKYYNPISLFRPWTLNGRLHDKYILTDNSTLLAGGRNTFDYFLQNKGSSISSDREVLVCHKSGDTKNNVFTQTRTYFKKVWNLDYSKYCFNNMPLWSKDKVEAQIASYEKDYQENKPKNMNLMSLTIPVNNVSFLHNPTGMISKEPVLFYQLTEFMIQAKQNVLVQSPYANFSNYMYKRMKDVSDSVPQAELVINSVAVGDNMMASSDYLINKENIWDTGFDVYEYFGSRSAHGKSILIDDYLSIIGSFNFDMRSVYLNTETMIVVDGAEFQEQLAGHIRSIQEDTLKVNPSDGSYFPSDTAKEVGMDSKRLFIYRMIGPIIQLVRFLV